MRQLLTHLATGFSRRYFQPRANRALRILKPSLTKWEDFPHRFRAKSTVPGIMPSAIDREKLTEQTFGDAALAAELLGMFAAQIPTLLAAAAATDGAARADIAHRIKGSALAIGATSAAESASRLEEAPGDPALVAALETACAAVFSEIGR
jgi:HPt (histidine-containing phosphotransfer) domain-containing protein